MSTTEADRPDSATKTRILFDLADELRPEEIAAFTAAAEVAGKTLTEHFLNLTLRVEPNRAA